MEVPRAKPPERDPQERVKDYNEIYKVLPEPGLKLQASRCMGCGVPFCNNACPLGNLIPDWNDLVREGRWKEAIDQLHATNNFPEFTGLICPAPCESACVLDINDQAVTIKQIEYAIVERAFKEGWIVSRPPEERTGQTVGVIGAGPAGLAAAAELNQVGHNVVVYERDEAPGGLIRFGVPDAKLEKWMIDRRVMLLEGEGVEFHYNVDVGGDDLPIDQLRADARRDRDRDRLADPARARDPRAPISAACTTRWTTSTSATATCAQTNGDPAREVEPDDVITAKDKDVVVIGGGDTGMDCISNANREGATSTLLLDVYPEVPISGRYPDTPWPLQPRRLATTYALDEGGKREFGRQITSLTGRRARDRGARPRGDRHLVTQPAGGRGIGVRRSPPTSSSSPSASPARSGRCSRRSAPSSTTAATSTPRSSPARSRESSPAATPASARA